MFKLKIYNHDTEKVEVLELTKEEKLIIAECENISILELLN